MEPDQSCLSHILTIDLFQVSLIILPGKDDDVALECIIF